MRMRQASGVAENLAWLACKGYTLLFHTRTLAMFCAHSAPLRFKNMLVVVGLAACTFGASSARAQEATYRVYPVPVVSPVHTTPLPPDDARELVTDPSDAVASPFGWHDTDGAAGPEFSTTQGNNALVYFDANANGVPDAGEHADGGPMLAFDFPADLAIPAPTAAYTDAILANAFYWTNVFHDVLYHYGFDEAAGNFQATNYGGVGVGGDPVVVRVFANTSFSISFSTLPEGSRSRLTMGLDPIGLPFFFEFHNALLVHMLAHGLSDRLTGTPTNVGCLDNEEQMGEGWSDWYGLMFTQRPEDTRADPRNPFFTTPAPYSTDFDVNDFTHGDLASVAVPHGVGFIWATMLWEAAWDLIDAHGFSPDLYDADGGAGNQIALRLVTEGLKRQPCSPGFVDGRDAILSADAALYGGAHTDLLWAAFARRGLGFSAAQGSSNSTADNVEAFDVPPTTASEPERRCRGCIARRCRAEPRVRRGPGVRLHRGCCARSCAPHRLRRARPGRRRARRRRPDRRSSHGSDRDAAPGAGACTWFDWKRVARCRRSASRVIR